MQHLIAHSPIFFKTIQQAKMRQKRFQSVFQINILFCEWNTDQSILSHWRVWKRTEIYFWNNGLYQHFTPVLLLFFAASLIKAPAIIHIFDCTLYSITHQESYFYRIILFLKKYVIWWNIKCKKMRAANKCIQMFQF